jgi:hypothetical protein
MHLGRSIDGVPIKRKRLVHVFLLQPDLRHQRQRAVVLRVSLQSLGKAAFRRLGIALLQRALGFAP